MRPTYARLTMRRRPSLRRMQAQQQVQLTRAQVYVVMMTINEHGYLMGDQDTWYIGMLHLDCVAW